MKTFKNKSGQLGVALDTVLKLVLFAVIIGSALLIFNNVALADVKANDAARNLGVAFDVLALTAKETTINAACPAGVIFTVEGNRISAAYQSSLGGATGQYFYLAERDATLPEKKVIACTSGGTVEVKKAYNRQTIKPVISVQ